jgi:DNA uptake protein ComE-like DNA-binding protein
MIALLLILGGAALHFLPDPAPSPPPDCAHPVLVPDGGRLVALCQDNRDTSLGRVLAQAGSPRCATAAGQVSAGALVTPGEGCSARVTMAPSPTLLVLGLRLDLNRANEQDLRALPRIGPTLAHRIVADRSQRGPFPSVRALARVKGIGPATIAKIRGFVIAGVDGGGR